MRYSKLDKEGKFTLEGDPSMLYTVLLENRIGFLKSAPWTLSKALTIAVRYAIVRTQFKDKAGTDKERQIIDYQTHQNRLFPLIAQSIAMLFTANELDLLVAKMTQQVKEGNTSLVKEVHGIISGLKAFYTWMAVEGMEVARQCCGGAGFSLHAGIAHLVQDYTPYVTLEGDNTVMALQSARALVKDMKSVLKGDKLTGYTSYLGNAETLIK